MFKKILVANRGEIACRIMQTAQRLGIETVAVYSDFDRYSKHVAMANQAIHIGGNAPSESYLKGDKIIEVALECGAEAVHPGFGFLSENAIFARKCQGGGLKFVGPPAEAIEKMGSKAESKMIMEKAGVNVVPGYYGKD
jgi:3-methylcrotonyl-CoA carboxylase alpha subunit